MPQCVQVVEVVLVVKQHQIHLEEKVEMLLLSLVEEAVALDL
jgi:hypothetical protein